MFEMFLPSTITSPLVGRSIPANQVQQRRFTRSGRTHQTKKAAGLQGKIRVLQCHNFRGLSLENFSDITDLDRSHIYFLLSTRSPTFSFSGSLTMIDSLPVRPADM